MRYSSKKIDRDKVRVIIEKSRDLVHDAGSQLSNSDKVREIFEKSRNSVHDFGFQLSKS